MVKLLLLPAATVKPRISLSPLSLPLGTYRGKRAPLAKSMYELGWFCCASISSRTHS
jgi:hypothetical protein